MKYLITESQFDKILFKYLDNQDFIQIKKGDNVYFVNSEGDEYAQIRYTISDGWCYIHYKLIDEFSMFFSLGGTVSKEVIGIWVGHTLQMKVTKSLNTQYQEMYLELRIHK
jgi:hypothetical protein